MPSWCNAPPRRNPTRPRRRLPLRRQRRLPPGRAQRQAPQLASVTDKPPEGKGWVSEIKFDGYRLLCWLDHGKVRLLTRKQLDWTHRFQRIAKAVMDQRVAAARAADAAIMILGFDRGERFRRDAGAGQEPVGG